MFFDIYALRRMRHLGSPSLYSCWRDEHNNLHVGRSARGASQQTFEASVLRDFRQAHGFVPRILKRGRTM